MSNLSNAQAAELLSEISRYISESHALISGGKLVELSGLDSRVKLLCDAMLAFSHADRERYAAQLAELAAQLDGLARTLHEQKDAVSGEIVQAGGTQKAAIAYKTADAVDNFGKKDQ